MSGASYSPLIERRLMENAREIGNRLVADAIEQHGVLQVLCPFKRHRSAHTGHEFGAANQAVLEAVALQEKFDSRQWAPRRVIESQGGVVIPDAIGVRLISCKQDFRLVDRLDPLTKSPIINPETQEPEKEKVFWRMVDKIDPKTRMPVIDPRTGDPVQEKVDFPRTYYPLTVFPLEHTEKFTPKATPLDPAQARKLPLAVASVWDAVKMSRPTIRTSNELSYDIATDELRLPPKEAFHSGRPATNAAYQLANKLALASGHSARLNIRNFVNEDSYRENQTSVAVATHAAAAFLMTNHVDRFDPEMVEQTGLAEAKNLAQKLRSREVDMHLAVAQAHEIYRYMITGSKRNRVA